MSEEKHEEKTVSHTETHEHKSDEHKSGEHGKGGEKPPGPKVASISKAPAKRKPMPKGMRYAMRAAIVMVALLCVGAIIAALVRSHGGSNVAQSGKAATPKVASSSTKCPNFDPKERTVNSTWVDANPEYPGAACNFVFVILDGELETDGPGGEWTPDPNAIGHTSKKLIKKIRAKGESATILYTFCPIGKGPDDGSAVCKS